MHPEFDNDTFDAGSGKKIKNYFSNVGFSVILLAAVGIAATYLCVMLVSKYAPSLTDKDWYTWVVSLLPMYVFGLPAFFLSIRHTPSLPPEVCKINFGKWLKFLIIAFGVMGIGNYIGNFLMNLVYGLSGRQPANAVEELVLDSNMIYNVVFSVLLAPVIEELVFRKAVIDKTRGYGEKTAVILSALFFGLYHGNFYQLFYAFGVGLVLGYVYVRTGKIIHTILLHMSVNLVGGILPSLLISKLDTEALEGLLGDIQDADFLKSLTESNEALEAYMERISPMLPDLLMYSAYSILMFGLIVGGVIVLCVNLKKIRFEAAEFEIPSDRVGNTVFFNVGCVTAILLLLVYTALSLFV